MLKVGYDLDLKISSSVAVQNMETIGIIYLMSLIAK